MQTMDPHPSDTPDGGPDDPRIEQLENDNRRLRATVGLLEEILGSLHFVDILQVVTRRLGDQFGLDRCAVFLATSAGRTARLVASYEDPSIRQWDVELDRYPEVREALETGEMVFITDVQADARLKHVQGILRSRHVRSITVVPMTGPDGPFGVIFLRTFEHGPRFSQTDIQFIHHVAGLTAKALHAATSYAAAVDRQEDTSTEARRLETRHRLMLAFLLRLLQTTSAGGPETLSTTTSEELDRLVEIAIAVFAEESQSALSLRWPPEQP
jgi:GAF domain-containing protein